MMIREFILKRIDRKIAKLGFTKISEDIMGIHYERVDCKNNFTHIVSIGYGQEGLPIIQSYQKGPNNDGFNNMVSLTIREMELFLKRLKRWC